MIYEVLQNQPKQVQFKKPIAKPVSNQLASPRELTPDRRQMAFKRLVAEPTQSLQMKGPIYGNAQTR